MGLVPRNWLDGNTTKNVADNGKDQLSGRNLLAARVGFPGEWPSVGRTYRIFKDKPHAWENANLTLGRGANQACRRKVGGLAWLQSSCR